MSTLNYEDLRNNSLSDLKKEAQSLGIEIPLHPSKDQMIALISSKIEPNHISSKLLNPSSSSSSTSNSPHPHVSAPTASSNSMPSQRNPTNYPISSPKSNNANSSPHHQVELTKPKNEEREQSPQLPSKSNRHNSNNSANGSAKSRKHSHDSKTVFVDKKTNSNNNNNNNGSNHNQFVLPKKLIILSYLSGGLAALFLIFSLMNLLFIVPALALAALFYYVHIQLGTIVCQKANSLSIKISNFLGENGGEANKKAIQTKFNADRFLMNQAAVTLKRSGKVTIVKRKNQGEIWKLTEK